MTDAYAILGFFGRVYRILIQILYSTTVTEDVNVKLKSKGFYTLLRKRGLINIGLSHILALNHFQNK